VPSTGKQPAEAGDVVIGEVLLRFLDGENEGVEIRVNPPRELTIGRSEECDIFLGEKKISRKHCRVVVNEKGVKALDLQSTNGTFVNKKKIVEADLKGGDKLQIGTTVIEITIERQKKAAISVEETLSGARAEEKVESVPAFKAREPMAETVAEQEIDSPSGALDAGLDSAFDLEKSDPKPAKPLSGNLSAMGLADLLQNLAQNRKSGVLRIRSSHDGAITVSEGKVIGAEVGPVSGVKALYRMLGWNEGEFELHPLPSAFDPAKIRNPIRDSTETLLMEGFRQFDELEKIRKGLPKLSVTLRLKVGSSAPLSKLHPRVLDILQLVMNGGTFESVMNESPFSDLETGKIVFYLLKKGYIVAA
jgi:pSer/pThr/pTyr-binding forkhead associated (FHA) protein